MNFEGSEKKLEVILSSKACPWTQYPPRFFTQLLKKSKTKIVNQFSNSKAQAYLLSESSLFIWKRRLILITCGETTLAQSARFILSQAKKDISALFFQRKNEFFPYRQKSNFFDDIKKIRRKIKGRAIQFGDLDEHYFYLFYLDKEFSPKKEDQTLEVLMYGLSGPLADLLQEGASSQEIKQALNLDQTFPGFVVQDYVFKPRGYSLNALRGDEYLTIHATPQEQGFYVSFESNMRAHPLETVKKILILFQPRSFDMILFTPSSAVFKPEADFSHYMKTAFYKTKLECGFDVHFLSFRTRQNQARAVFQL